MNKYFTSKTVSPFYGITYAGIINYFFKFEKDTIDTYDPHPELVYEDRKDFSYGFDYSINSNFTIELLMKEEIIFFEICIQK